MNALSSFCIRFSGITLRFRFPEAVSVPEEWRPLVCPDCVQADAEYALRLIRRPLQPEGQPSFAGSFTTIYATDTGWLRIYPLLTARDGCQVACLLRPDGKHILYFPACDWDHNPNRLSILPFIGCEALLLRNNAFLLHSSVVLHRGKTILFSGPSGAGKSTQAALWESTLGAKILNGDRCVVMKKADGFYGGGSLWSGSSRIFQPEQAPIAGILLVHQAQENSLERMDYEAFTPLFTQSIVNNWDTGFMEIYTDLLSELIDRVPIYRLNCRPDADAVLLVRDALF